MVIETNVLQAWRNGDISLGKMAEQRQMDKHELRSELSGIGLPIIDYPVKEVSSEVDWLLQSQLTKESK